MSKVSKNVQICLMCPKKSEVFKLSKIFKSVQNWRKKWKKLFWDTFYGQVRIEVSCLYWPAGRRLSLIKFSRVIIKLTHSRRIASFICRPHLTYIRLRGWNTVQNKPSTLLSVGKFFWWQGIRYDVQLCKSNLSSAWTSSVYVQSSHSKAWSIVQAITSSGR